LGSWVTVGVQEGFFSKWSDMVRQCSLSTIALSVNIPIEKLIIMYNEDIAGFKASVRKGESNIIKRPLWRNVLVTLTVEMVPKLNKRTHKSGKDFNISRKPEQNAVFDI
jgi:hypothetical protein